MVKVSVVVPIYNIAENLLKKCVESILNQTEKSIEVFLVDDGSTNNALEICKAYRNDSRITVIHQDNAGVSVARNKGLENSCGEWVMFVDPDDFLELDCLEKLLQSAQAEDDIVQNSSYYYYYAQERRTACFFNEDRVFKQDEKLDLYYKLLSYGNPYQKQGTKAPCGIGAPWGKIFRKHFLKVNNIWFEPQLRRAQDIIFNLYAVAKARQVRYINESLYNYNYNHLGTMHSKFSPVLYEYYIRFANSRYGWYKNNLDLLDEKIKDVYYLGSFNNVMFCLKSGPLHPLYDGDLKKIKAECKALMEMDCFSWLKNTKRKTQIKVTCKNRILQFFVKNEMWFFFYCAMRIKNLIKRR